MTLENTHFGGFSPLTTVLLFIAQNQGKYKFKKKKIAIHNLVTLLFSINAAQGKNTIGVLPIMFKCLISKYFF